VLCRFQRKILNQVDEGKNNHKNRKCMLFITSRSMSSKKKNPIDKTNDDIKGKKTVKCLDHY